MTRQKYNAVFKKPSKLVTQKPKEYYAKKMNVLIVGLRYIST